MSEGFDIETVECRRWQAGRAGRAGDRWRRIPEYMTGLNSSMEFSEIYVGRRGKIIFRRLFTCFYKALFKWAVFFVREFEMDAIWLRIRLNEILANPASIDLTRTTHPRRRTRRRVRVASAIRGVELPRAEATRDQEFLDGDVGATSARGATSGHAQPGEHCPASPVRFLVAVISLLVPPVRNRMDQIDGYALVVSEAMVLTTCDPGPRIFRLGDHAISAMSRKTGHHPSVPCLAEARRQHLAMPGRHAASAAGAM